MEKWRLRIQLDSKQLWFLSVFVRDDGRFEKYSLDKETANDSHYEFTNEQVIRKNIGSITNFVGFPIPLVALSAHIE